MSATGSSTSSSLWLMPDARNSAVIRLGLSVLCLVGLVGCTLPGTTRPVVKIGLVAPFEGWYRPRGYDALYAVRLAIQEANRGGGVAGYQVELVALDDHLDPYWAPRRARELVGDPAVMGVVGCFSSATAHAAGPVYHKAGLPLVTPASIGAQGDSVFVLAPSPTALIRAAIGHIRVQGAARVALLHDREREPLAEAVRGEVKVMADVGLVSQGWLEALIQARPDWVICTAGARLGGEALQQARRRGLRASFVGGPEWGTDAFSKMAGDAASGAWFVTGAAHGEDLREAHGFLLAYRELGGHEPGPDAVLAYDATRMLLAALERAIRGKGHPTRQAVGEALLEVTLSGVTGSVAFDRQGRRTGAPVWIYRAD